MKNRMSDLLKLSVAALQRQLPLLTEFQWRRATMTHHSTATKPLSKCLAKKLFYNLEVGVSGRQNGKPHVMTLACVKGETKETTKIVKAGSRHTLRC